MPQPQPSPNPGQKQYITGQDKTHHNDYINKHRFEVYNIGSASGKVEEVRWDQDILLKNWQGFEVGCYKVQF